MNRIPLPPRALAVASLAFAMSAAVPCSSRAATESSTSIPRGTLSANRDLLRVGTKPTLTWQVEFPSEITTLIDIIPPNTIQPKRDVTMRVRVLGASFQQTTTQYLQVQSYWKLNGGSWQTVFDGYQTNVNASKVLVSQTVTKNSRINFGARGYRSGWLTLYNTASNTPNLVMLKNGDSVPSTTPAFRQGQIESFLKPYLDGNSRIKIGPKDLILLFELGQTDPESSGFDLQDMVMLVTFE